MNQLVREDNVGGETVIYTYDNGGNILTRQKYTYTPKEETPTELLNTVTYGYSSGEWKDLLTTFDGDTLTYDAVGNPLNYRDGMTMTWSDGRRLGSVTSSNGETYSYTYNESGIRTKKTVNGGTTEYSLNGTNIISETLSTGEKLYFFYDEKGSPVAFNYYAANSDTKITYYLVKNIQGDVISLVNSYGQTVATYTYDTWGKLLSITGTLADTIGEINPYRYRSYLYDAETGFYYLNSRYYDPVTGRFLNADNAISGVGGSMLGYNMFVYCFNNPVNMSDPSGNWPKLSTVFTVIAVSAVVVAAVALTVATCGATAPALAVAGGGVIGGISAGAAATAASVATGAMIVASVSTAAAIVTSTVENTKPFEIRREHSVYVMRDKTTNEVKYVGRTIDPDRRQRQHSNDPTKANLNKMEVKFTGLTKIGARALEQVLISAYSLDNLYNARREIAKGNVAAFSGKIENVVSIFDGMLEDECLNLMEN